jgi:hypothetical protein
MSARTTPAPLPDDLEAGLKRLKLSTIRRQAPELLLTAKTQRWTPEETLRCSSSWRSPPVTNRTAATGSPPPASPSTRPSTSSTSPSPPFNKASHDYLITLDWIGRADNLCLVGPAGTGKSHYLIAIGRAAVEHGHRVRYFTAVELIEQLWRAVADNTVGRSIEQICRHDLIIIDEIGFAPLDHTGCQLLFRLIAAAYERRSVAIASHSPFEQWGRFLPDQPTAVSLLDRLCHHAHIITTNGDSYRLRHRTTGRHEEG